MCIIFLRGQKTHVARHMHHYIEVCTYMYRSSWLTCMLSNFVFLHCEKVAHHQESENLKIIWFSCFVCRRCKEECFVTFQDWPGYDQMIRNINILWRIPNSLSLTHSLSPSTPCVVGQTWGQEKQTSFSKQFCRWPLRAGPTVVCIIGLITRLLNVSMNLTTLNLQWMYQLP